MPSSLDDFRSNFSAADLAVVAERAPVHQSGSRLDAISMAASWAAHVNKLDHDRHLAADDHSVWTEHDLVAALFVRDFLHNALVLLPSDLAARIEKLTTDADDLFRSFTSEDSGIRITKIAEVNPEGRGWWWYRLPTDGPIAIDLANYDTDGNYIARPEPTPPS
jgi:hypothetical protein